MLNSDYYLKKIRNFYDITSLIKILYGKQEISKSLFLKQIIDDIKTKGVKDEQIIYFDFELKDDFNFNNAKKLYTYIKELAHCDKIYYVFLNEIQKINRFEETINSLRVLDNFSIFITISTSKRIFLELSTELSGRYVSFKI